MKSEGGCSDERMMMTSKLDESGRKTLIDFTRYLIYKDDKCSLEKALLIRNYIFSTYDFIL